MESFECGHCYNYSGLDDVRYDYKGLDDVKHTEGF